MIGNLLSAGADLLGGFLDRKERSDMFDKQQYYQDYYTRNAIQLRVADAQKAGIHPLAALGASVGSPRPVYVGEPNMGRALSRAGQNVGIAINKLTEKYLAEKVKQEKIITDQMGQKLSGSDSMIYNLPQWNIKGRTGVDLGNPAMFTDLEKPARGKGEIRRIKRLISQQASEPLESDTFAKGERFVEAGSDLGKAKYYYRFPNAKGAKKHREMLHSMRPATPGGQIALYDVGKNEWVVVRSRPGDNRLYYKVTTKRHYRMPDEIGRQVIRGYKGSQWMKKAYRRYMR